MSSLPEVSKRVANVMQDQEMHRVQSTSSLQRISRGNGGGTLQTSFSDIDLDSQALTSSTEPKDFFKQYSFLRELRCIDSKSSLSSKSSTSPLEGLLESAPERKSSAAPSQNRGSLLRDVEPLADSFTSSYPTLKAIMNHDFKRMKPLDLISFVSEHVISYVESNCVKTRALSVGASAKLMQLAVEVWVTPLKTNGLSKRLQPEVQAILAQIVLVAVADPSKDVRFVAICSIDKPEFRPYLLQPEVLSTLFMCFHDESLGVRDSALSLVGRIGNRNPAYIVPAMRSYLTHLLISLRLDGQHFSKKRREATELIYTLVHSAQNFIDPYISVLIDALMLRLEEARRTHDTDAALPVLGTIAEMGGTISRLDLKPYRESLTPLIVSSVLEVQGVDALFRRAALRALAALVQNTGFVIKPYVEHPTLLPRLLELLRSETDAGVRLEVEALLGSLGAVDPNDHKYAALPILSQGGRFHHYGRGFTSDVHGRSFLRGDSHLGRGSAYWAGSATHRPQSGPILRSATLLGAARQGQGIVEHSAPFETFERFYEADDRCFAHNTLNTLPSKPEDLQPSLSWFSSGGARLEKRIIGYIPEWARDEIEFASLVGQLDHPFTQSDDYFSSVLLDELHKLISTRGPRYHLREACQAIVNILISVGPRCTYFLPEVVPRVSWLVEQISANESSGSPLDTNLKQYTIQSLSDIVAAAGQSFTPYAFDTILLIWNYLRHARSSPQITIAFCSLLTSIRQAIGDEFKPAIATILPVLLEILAEDKNPRGLVACAVLNTLESFCPLFEEYDNTVLNSLTANLNMKRPLYIRSETLISLIRIVQSMDFVNVLSSVIHPLVLILAGITCASEAEEFEDEVVEPTALRSSLVSGDPPKRNMAVLAAVALFEVGLRSQRGFNVYVPVVTKALKSSPVKKFNVRVYTTLKNLLLQRSPRVVKELLHDQEDNVSIQDALLPFRAYPGGLHPGIPKDVVHRRDGSFSEAGQYGLVAPQGSLGRVEVDELILVQKWEIEPHFNADDWVKWISDLGAIMFQQSGCPAFRACVGISKSYPTFAKNLFNPAFLSCWTSPISKDTKSRICQALDAAISSSTIPLNVLQALLNLFEFMDHDEKPLPAGIEKLAATACKCGALAKALRYREQDYSQYNGKPDKMLHEITGEDGLIAIYEKLDHIESAVGTIFHYEKETGERVQEQWYEKLQRWDDALKVYENDIITHKDDRDLLLDQKQWDAMLGRLRCLNQMGEWRRMIELLHDARENCQNNLDALHQLALEGKALSVSFDLGRWEDFEEWLQYIRPDSFEGCFYNSLLSVKRGKEDPSSLDRAEDFVIQASRHLDLELTARVSEGYPRAYTHIVRAQTLVELKEMISFLRMPEGEDIVIGRQRLQDVWDKRLLGCKRDRATWYRILMTRALILNPVENKSQWLEYATMCRKAKLLPMASEVLHRLVSSYAENLSLGQIQEPGSSTLKGQLFFDLEDVSFVLSLGDLDLKFACIKYLWAQNKRVEAYRALESCRNEYLTEAGIHLLGSPMSPYGTVPSNEKKRVLAGEVFSKLSKWGHRLRDSGIVTPSITDPLEYARLATEVRPSWYKAWHYWAVMNGSRFEALIERRLDALSDDLKRSSISYGHFIGRTEKLYLTETVRGFFKAIDLCGKSRLEDSLKVLTLWFKYGGYANMHHEFNAGFEGTNISRWLEVVPQIIARLHTPYSVVQKGVKELLARIGKAHPHVAVYPLTVAKSTGGTEQNMRSQAAREILDQLKRDHHEIVVQAEMVAQELVRVAVLWTEMWYEKLEEASRLYFVEHDVDGMIDILLPLHSQVEHAETPCEREFVSEFARELHEAAQLCRSYQIGRDRGASEEHLNQYITQAWAIYTLVFRKIQKHQQGLQELHLKHVSNGLSEANSLMLAVPGTYNPDEGAAIVGIEQFNPQLHVMQSKQRPRKLSIIGSNGQEYQFLLKGHEDLRQDERVMQVFDLVNKLFAKSEQRRLLNGVGLKTYSVIALSANAGLIEWVPDCDTMHALVKNYREVRNIFPNIEHRIMLRCAPEPERLTLLQKVDLFEYMQQSTSGADLSRVIWLRSRNSEMWLDRRTMYAKSLAITSMAGYLLGLGDRHPSNLMIERVTGKIMHIDFGDCFEVAMKREKYPEKVPFRLTRMMVAVLEPCGVEGYFRHTSVATLEVLRQKNAKESLMSMMEAFVYDPLIRWKLLGAEELTQLKAEREAAAAGARSSCDYRQTSQDASFSAKNNVDSSSGPGSGELVNVTHRSRRQASRDHSENQGLEDDFDRNSQLGSSLSGLGRDVARDIDEIVRSLTQTGSLAASLRRHENLEKQRREARALEGSDAPGAIATPLAAGTRSGWSGSRNDSSEAMINPSYEARTRLARVMPNGGESEEKITTVSNERAQLALNRFSDKLCGTDYDPDETLSVSDQIDRLIFDARNIENLCTLFLGWCAFW